MSKERTGTITLGISLVGLGILFLIHQFFPFLTYRILMMVWPCILILLGIEILASYFLAKDAPLKFDGVSIVLIILLTLFSLGMAAVDFALQYAEELCHLPL